jgi:hypothetical protein
VRLAREGELTAVSAPSEAATIRGEANPMERARKLLYYLDTMESNSALLASFDKALQA